MIKRTRTILFLICFFLFISITPMVVFYCQGYRFDFGTRRIIQTGGLYLEVTPKQVEIYLNDKLTKKTGFMSDDVLIKNLLPKKYKIMVTKEGYQSWEKNLEIKERVVTEAKNIILFPKNLNFNLLTTEVENFWFSPDDKNIILKETDEKGWALKIYDLDKNLKSHLIAENDISQRGAELINLSFSENPKEANLEVGTKEQLKYFTLRFDIIPPVLTEKKNPTTTNDIIISQKFNNDVYYLDKSGYVFKTDASFSSKERINEEGFPVQQETEYKLAIFPNYIFLQENQALYLFNPDSGAFEKLFEPIKDLKISPDSQKVAYFSNYEIWLLFPNKERVFLTRFSEKINDLFWLNSDYLILNVGEKIKVAEIDNRDKINIYDLGEFKEPKIFWNEVNKKLYILSNGGLYESEEIIK